MDMGHNVPLGGLGPRYTLVLHVYSIKIVYTPKTRSKLTLMSHRGSNKTVVGLYSKWHYHAHGV